MLLPPWGCRALAIQWRLDATEEPPRKKGSSLPPWCSREAVLPDAWSCGEGASVEEVRKVSSSRQLAARYSLMPETSPGLVVLRSQW